MADLARAIDEGAARLREVPDTDGYRPAATAALVGAGLHLATVPQRLGGFGGRATEAATMLAAIGAVDGSAALGLAMHTHVVGALVDAGGWRDGIADELLRAVVRDGVLVNAAATEEAGGSPARGALPVTSASRDGDGWRISGEKAWTTWLPALRYALVSARIGPEDEPAALERPVGDVPGDPLIGHFLVDLSSLGVERLPAFEALGMRGSASGRLRMTDVAVAGDGLAFVRRAGGPDPRGPAPGMWFGLAVAAVYLGVGEGAVTAVADWAVARRPGGGSSVAEIPTVQVRLGRADAATRAARIVLFDVARRWDATPPPDRDAIAAGVPLAKLLATNAGVTATDEALRVAGGPGFLRGPIERAFRDARAGLINPPLDDLVHQGLGRDLAERARARSA